MDKLYHGEITSRKPQSVSVIVAAFNAEETIYQAVSSVFDQVDCDIELIVVDDRSTDSTVARLNSIIDPRVRVIRQLENKGPSAARNRALNEATKDWVAVLDADDWFDKDRLSVLTRMAILHDLDVIADDQYLVKLNEREKTIRSASLDFDLSDVEPRLIDIEVLLNNPGLGIIQPVIRRDFLVRYGIKYQDHNWYGEDFRLLYDLLRCGARMAIIGKPLYHVRIHSSSLTANRVKMFSGMKRMLEDIEQDLKDSGRVELLEPVRKAIAQAEETVAYGSVMDPLKQGQLLKALNALRLNPRFIAQFSDRMQRKIKRYFV